MKTNPAELAGDIRECAGRLADLGFPGFAEDLRHAASELIRLTTPQPERLSFPPSNGELRRRASEHFAKAREYTSEAVRWLRRET